jgi:UDP-N-acetylglucosamine diphosphorylase / glucose-1-phosphate thymidylyltransferase / UDP-N-acetylgalactosamine diphosphorylase / glucosamine-1-phosphate N-acetyltransferase / galactosamine-1-phosphate N-acetyltransferase
VLGESVTGSIVADHLHDFTEFDAPPAMTRVIPPPARIANSRCIPSLVVAPSADVWMCEGRVAAVSMPRSFDPATLRGGAAALDAITPAAARVVEIPGRWMEDVWDYIRDLPIQLAEDIPHLAADLELDLAAAAAATRLGDGALYVERGAIIEPFTVFDLRNGPVLIRSEATVHAFTRIVGPCAIGHGSTVTADRIATSSIGERCRVHGELSVSIILGHTNKSHDGFVGHSYLGRWVNLGAGTITSNLKNTYGPVHVHTMAGARDTGLTFLGSLIGDYVRTGIGLRLTTGTIVGAGANIFGSAAPRSIPPFAWGAGEPLSTFALPKFLDVAERQMARRDVSLTVQARSALSASHVLALATWSSAATSTPRVRTSEGDA